MIHFNAFPSSNPLFYFSKVIINLEIILVALKKLQFLMEKTICNFVFLNAYQGQQNKHI